MPTKEQVMNANAAQRFARVTQRDSKGRAKVIILPGHEGRRYMVILRRVKTKGVSVELCVPTANGTVKPRFAAERITYHAMAALQVAAQENGYRVAWCKTPEDAWLFSRIGGIPFEIYNHDNPSVKLYGVYKELK